MKITNNRLRQIIKEELGRSLANEGLGLAKTNKHKDYKYEIFSQAKGGKIKVTSPDGKQSWTHNVVKKGEFHAGAKMGDMGKLAKKAIDAHAKDGKMPPGWK